jgi:hypothetical protein
LQAVAFWVEKSEVLRDSLMWKLSSHRCRLARREWLDQRGEVGFISSSSLWSGGPAPVLDYISIARQYGLTWWLEVHFKSSFVREKLSWRKQR